MKIKSLLWVLVIVLTISNAVIWVSILQGAKDPVLKVSFLNVGQGDAIFIESPSGIQLLVDSGPNLSVLRALGKEMSFFDRSIDAILATHPDADHIGGFPEILKRYKVGNVLLTSNESQTPVFLAYRSEILNEGAPSKELLRGNIVDLGAGVFLEILFPDRNLSGADPNTSSVVARLVYGETSFLLTGDSPIKIENFLSLIDGTNLKAGVLKVGHHGSRTSSSKAFLSAVSPEYAVISAGCNNRYGHPHKEVVANLSEIESEILSTCESGTIRFESDGKVVVLK